MDLSHQINEQVIRNVVWKKIELGYELEVHNLQGLLELGEVRMSSLTLPSTCTQSYLHHSF